MATQPRPWFRLGSISRPATTPAPAPGPGPTPAPAPAPAAPPAPMIRPQLIRPLGTIQPPQTAPTPQPEAPAPQPEAPTPPPVTTSSPSSSPTRVSSPSFPPTRVSAPSSPATRVSAPSSPATRVSAPSSPATRVSAPSTSVPASPATKLPSPRPLVSQTTQAPQTTTTSVPSSPKASSVLITSTSLPPSPATKSVPPPTSPTTRATSTASTRVPSPGYFPRTISPAAQTTPQSPKLKPTAPPPSPLTLPPAQFKPNVDTTESIIPRATEPRIPAEAEQKTVLVQKNFEKPNQRHNGVSQNHELRETHGIVHNGINTMSRELINSKEKSTSKKLSDSEDMGAKVITIAGENKGAVMELIQSPKKQEFGGRPYSLFNKDPFKSGTKSGSSSSDEGNPKAKKDKAGKAKNAQPMSAFMNSNIQGVNNSIMFNSSCNHHDPGVHYALLRKPAGGGFYVKDDPTGLHN